MELQPPQRASFLDELGICDPDLRVEVESLLSSHQEAGNFLDDSALSKDSLSPGTRLGGYEVIELIGAGGMGEVYRARDRKLLIEVAIKVLPRYLAADPDRIRRFEQEAQAAAALNHPNILSINYFGQHDNTPYLVTELLEGETLRERLQHGALGLRATIDLGVQIGKVRQGVFMNQGSDSNNQK